MIRTGDFGVSRDAASQHNDKRKANNHTTRLIMGGLLKQKYHVGGQIVDKAEVGNAMLTTGCRGKAFSNHRG
jgi:hypothetical protein